MTAATLAPLAITATAAFALAVALRTELVHPDGTRELHETTGHSLTRWTGYGALTAMSLFALASFGPVGGIIAGGGAPTTPPQPAASGVEIYFAVDWSNGSCDGVNKNTNNCISNNGQWVVTAGNQPPHDTVMVVLPAAGNPAVAPWADARPGTSGKVTRYDSHGTSNGGIQGKVLVDSSALKTHFGRVFILLEDSVQLSNHPVSYKHQTLGGFQGVILNWSSQGNVDVIVDSTAGGSCTDGTPPCFSSGVKSVGHTRPVLFNTWYCVQWETRTYANGGDPRRTIRPYWMKRNASSWSVLDTVVSPATIVERDFPYTLRMDEVLAGPDSLAVSVTMDTTYAKWVQIAQEGAAGTNPVAGAYRGFWLAEFAISYEGHIPCTQATTTVGTTTF